MQDLTGNLWAFIKCWRLIRSNPLTLFRWCCDTNSTTQTNLLSTSGLLWKLSAVIHRATCLHLNLFFAADSLNGIIYLKPSSGLFATLTRVQRCFKAPEVQGQKFETFVYTAIKILPSSTWREMVCTLEKWCYKATDYFNNKTPQTIASYRIIYAFSSLPEVSPSETPTDYDSEGEKKQKKNSK